MSTNLPPHPDDWHPADIKAALEKKGWSLRRIAREHGYSEQSVKDVLRRRFGPVEAIVAEILGVAAACIWPSRYRPPRGTRRRTVAEARRRRKGERKGATR